MKKPKLIKLIIVAALLLSSLIVVNLFAATSDTATGSFTIDAQPDVSSGSVDFVDASYALTSTLTPDSVTNFGVNFTITHSSQMSDIKNATIYIFDDSVHSTDYNTASADGIQLTVITWIETSDTYNVDQGSLTEWVVDTGASIDPGTGGTETTFVFSTQFDISRAARYSTTWNVTVHVYDDDLDTDSNAETGLVTMQENLEILFSSSTFSWGSGVQPSSTNNTISSGALTLTIRANRQWELQISSADFQATAETDVDVELNNIIVWDEDNTPGGANSIWIRNTVNTALGNWDNQAPMSSESTISRNVYIFLNPGALFVGGKTWSAIVTVAIQANV